MNDRPLFTLLLVLFFMGAVSCKKDKNSGTNNKTTGTADSLKIHTATIGGSRIWDEHYIFYLSNGYNLDTNKIDTFSLTVLNDSSIIGINSDTMRFVGLDTIPNTLIYDWKYVRTSDYSILRYNYVTNKIHYYMNDHISAAANSHSDFYSK